MATKLQVQVPSFVFLPADLTVKGSVKSASGPLNGATVTVTFANTSVRVKTVDDGTFKATLNLPFSAVFAGSQDLIVTAHPAEPWQASSQTQTSVS